MEDIVAKIKNEIQQDFYKTNFPNDGQRFVAWYLHNIFLLDKNGTKNAITDGANDKQIDAVYIDEDEQRIFIIQGKFYTGISVDATPVREMISVWSQFNDLSHMQEGANGKLKIKLSEISKALEDDAYTICFMLITTSMFSEQAQKDITQFQAKLSEEENPEFDYEFIAVDQSGIADNYSKVLEQTNPVLNYTMHLLPGKSLFTEIGSTNILIAVVPLTECINLPGISDGTLFQKNVRQSLGITNSVNKKIRNTINGEKCREFFFFHNGITAICNRMEQMQDGSMRFYGLNVVNGCQSLNTILSCSEKVKKQQDAYVLFRFYEIPQRDRAESISINTNTQSAVKARDLKSNDKRVLRMKKAYEQRYADGYFATKRGDVVPADKDKAYAIELSALSKYLTAWYMQRPNLSYGETKIFDKYFDILFKNEYRPEDIYALKFWMNKIMEIWTDANPKGLDEVYLTMKAYAPYHFLYAISALFSKLSKQSDVPSPADCMDKSIQYNLTDAVISLVANCMNSAIQSETAKYQQDGKTFIPQNWVKNKASISAIQTAIINYLSFLPTMNADMYNRLKDLSLDASKFSYRVKADD